MDDGRFSQVQNQNPNPYGSVALDRVPQWSYQETQDFLMIRAELDPDFVEIKRNKLLWESVSARMKEIGYNRTPLQCKSKWKNLITRYKGCETMQELEMRQLAFPFYNEMQTIFNSRMQRTTWQQEAPEGSGGGATSEGGDGEGREKKKKKRKESSGGSNSSSSTVDELKEVMEEYMRQQMEMEMRWIKAYEEREGRRREREMEWRRRMEALESERLMMMRRWREREEQRRMREEARAVRRDALITALLKKINRD